MKSWVYLSLCSLYLLDSCCNLKDLKHIEKQKHWKSVVLCRQQKSQGLWKNDENQPCWALICQQRGGGGDRRQQKSSFKEPFLFLSQALSHLPCIPRSDREWPQSQFLPKEHRVSRCTKQWPAKQRADSPCRSCLSCFGAAGAVPQHWDTALAFSGLPPVQAGKCHFPSALFLYYTSSRKWHSQLMEQK